MDMSPAATRAFSSLLEQRTGQQLAISRRWRIEAALKPLMRDREIATLDTLAMNLTRGADPRLADQVVEALLNNETYFFREPAAFDLLNSAIAKLAEARLREKRLRIWCAGCSTGQEAYSLAMTFAEAGALWGGWTIEIVGTDISGAAVNQAREGLYTQFEIQRGLPIRSMMRWFDAAEEQWRARPELRAMVRFQTHNLLDTQPPPLRADVILCRNVLLYFGPAARTAAFDRLAAAIVPDGVLMLGAGETVLGQTERFHSDPALRGLYRLS
jgi:chemotaxis protein methyltransferase CheR